MRRYNRLALTRKEHNGTRNILAVALGVLLVALLAVDGTALYPIALLF